MNESSCASLERENSHRELSEREFSLTTLASESSRSLCSRESFLVFLVVFLPRLVIRFLSPALERSVGGVL